MKNNLKIINQLSIVALLFIFFGQVVWLCQVRGMKIDEFSRKAGDILEEVTQKYITDEGDKMIVCGKFSYGCCEQEFYWWTDNVGRSVSFSSGQRLTQLISEVTYDYLYQRLQIDIVRLDSMYRKAFLEEGIPPLIYWSISDKNTRTTLLTCGKVRNNKNRSETIPVSLGFDCHHQLIAVYEVPFIFKALTGILLVEGIFLIGFISCLLWLWYSVKLAYRETEVQRMGAAHLEHELKKPISILVMAVEDLMETDEGVLTAREQLKIRMMRIRLIKMANVTDTMLTALGDAELELKCVSLNVRNEMKLIVEMFTILKPYAGIHVNIAPEAVEARLDEACFCYMVINLVDNAIKYSGDHPLINIDCWIENDKFVLAVRDNGIGIPKRKQKRIFRKFYRITNRCMRRITGFGLGLTFVQKVVNAYRGEIKVESNVGQGSNFIIRLPQ